MATANQSLDEWREILSQPLYRSSVTFSQEKIYCFFKPFILTAFQALFPEGFVDFFFKSTNPFPKRVPGLTFIRVTEERYAGT